jgi:hypothetical protein
LGNKRRRVKTVDMTADVEKEAVEITNDSGKSFSEEEDEEDSCFILIDEIELATAQEAY